MKKAGFGDPEPGGSHQIMQKGRVTVVISNPHRGDISANLLARLLRDVGISREEWQAL